MKNKFLSFFTFFCHTSLQRTNHKSQAEKENPFPSPNQSFSSAPPSRKRNPSPHLNCCGQSFDKWTGQTQWGSAIKTLVPSVRLPCPPDLLFLFVSSHLILCQGHQSIGRLPEHVIEAIPYSTFNLPRQG